jgi:hypothetical protein
MSQLRYSGVWVSYHYRGLTRHGYKDIGALRLFLAHFSLLLLFLAIFVGVKTHFGRSENTFWSEQTHILVGANDVCGYRNMMCVAIGTCCV